MVLQAGLGVDVTRVGRIDARAAAVKSSLRLDNQVRIVLLTGCPALNVTVNGVTFDNESSYLENNGPLVRLTHREGSTGAGELDDEDEEEDDHVDEEHDLVLLHGSYDPQHGDEEEEDSACCDASNDGQTCDDTRDLAWIKSFLVCFT